MRETASITTARPNRRRTRGSLAHKNMIQYVDGAWKFRLHARTSVSAGLIRNEYSTASHNPRTRSTRALFRFELNAQWLVLEPIQSARSSHAPRVPGPHNTSAGCFPSHMAKNPHRGTKRTSSHDCTPVCPRSASQYDRTAVRVAAKRGVT